MFGQETPMCSLAPTVDCYKSKAMFILPPSKYDKLKKIFLDPKIKSTKIYYKLKRS